MKLKQDANGFSPLEIIIAIVVLLAIGFSTWFFVQARNNKTENKVATAPSSVVAESGSTIAVKSKDGTTLDTVAENSEQTTSESPAVQPSSSSIDFVSTAGWVERTSPDGKYSIKIGGYQTYGSCNKNASTIFVGVVMLDGNNNYNCSTPQEVITVLPGLVDGGHMVRARVIFVEASKLWNRPNAVTQNITLANGQSATRYTYQNVVDGITYDNIEYTTRYNGVDYLAINHWESAIDNDRYGIAGNYFDTIVQQTWEFN